MTRYGFVAFALALTLSCMPAAPASADLRQAIANGKASLGVRYRFEEVDQDNFAKDAKASTARARMTWNSAATGAFTLGIEADYALTLGIDSFNSTTNGKTQYPVVADPEGLDLNQAFVKYARRRLDRDHGPTTHQSRHPAFRRRRRLPAERTDLRCRARAARRRERRPGLHLSAQRQPHLRPR